MSKRNEMVRQRYGLFNAFMSGELSSEAYAEEFDPEVEVLWRDERAYPDFPKHLRGIDEVLDFTEQYREGWIDVIAEPLEVLDAPDDRVLALIRQSGRGRQSGVPIVIHFYELWTIRDGKVRKIEYFRHRADALAAAGLRAED